MHSSHELCGKYVECLELQMFEIETGFDYEINMMFFLKGAFLDHRAWFSLERHKLQQNEPYFQKDESK